jgi:hypothetical protein
MTSPAERTRDLPGPRWGVARWLALVMVLVLFGLLAFGARCYSLTIDEPMHLAAGYALLARGLESQWLVPARGHPLLVNALEALPIYLGQPDVPLENLPGWQSYHVDLVVNFIPYLQPLERAEVAGRVPVMLLAVLLAAVVYRWASDILGPRAALLALAALVFDPTLLAHARVATNDVGVTALGTLALYSGWRWWRSPGWGRAVATGVLLAATMLAKASGILWAGAFGLGTLWLGLVERRSGRFWCQGLAVVALSALLLWGAYGFTIGEVGGLALPLPAPAHWEALLRQGQSPAQRITFALGMRQRGNWWWYYPLAFLIKNPLPFLLGLGISAATLVRRAVPSRGALAVALFPVLYAAVAMIWGGNVGYRHMLPVHPFLYVLLAKGLSQWLRTGAPWRRWTLALLALWQVGWIATVFPDEMAFFNEIVGGPVEGYRYLVDSNVDWGQSFKELRDWLDAASDGEPGIAHMTYVDPEAYGIEHVALAPSRGGEPIPSPFRPPPGRYVVGATNLQGVVGHQEVPPALWWFRYAQPTASVGYSLFVYDVDPYDGRWVAQCITPTVPLTGQAIASGFGQEAPREVRFDCLESWIYPGGGTQPGWYALHSYLFLPNGLPQRLLFRPPQAADQFLARHLQEFRFSYRHERASRLPTFVLYEATTAPALPTSPAHAAPAGTAPANLDADPLPAPVPLDGPLSFLGLATRWEEEFVEVESFWEVTRGGIDRPFSIMAHLLAPGGDALGIDDGLGVSPLTLAEGDVVVQRHRFPRPAAETQLWLRTGAYWLDTMERWTIADAPGSDALFVPLR